jgi:hypothetical protein
MIITDCMSRRDLLSSLASVIFNATTLIFVVDLPHPNLTPMRLRFLRQAPVQGASGELRHYAAANTPTSQTGKYCRRGSSGRSWFSPAPYPSSVQSDHPAMFVEYRTRAHASPNRAPLAVRVRHKNHHDDLVFKRRLY